MLSRATNIQFQHNTHKRRVASVKRFNGAHAKIFNNLCFGSKLFLIKF